MHGKHIALRIVLPHKQALPTKISDNILLYNERIWWTLDYLFVCKDDPVKWCKVNKQPKFFILFWENFLKVISTWCNPILNPHGGDSLLTCPTYRSWECRVRHQTASLVLLVGIYLSFEGTSAGLKSIWTPPPTPFHPHEGHNCQTPGTPCRLKGRKYCSEIAIMTGTKQSKSQTQICSPIRSGLFLTDIDVILDKQNTQDVMWKPKSIRNQSGEILLCSLSRPSCTQWLLIFSDDLRGSLAMWTSTLWGAKHVWTPPGSMLTAHRKCVFF